MNSRKGRKKANVAGERYDSNALPVFDPVVKSTPGNSGQQAMPSVPSKDTKYFSTETPVDCSRWTVLYPNYIDSKKTLPQGRRIAKENACPDPIVADMGEVCRYFKLDHVIEPYKSYSRDWTVPGRLRVRLQTEAGEFCHAEIHTKKQLMKQMGEIIPKLQSRVDRLAKQAAAAAAASSSSASSSHSRKKGKKKGKKK